MDVDFPEEYKNLESVLIQINKKDNSLIPFFISNCQLQNNDTLKIKIDDVNEIADAKPLIGKEVYLPLNSLPILEGNKFYYHEVIGFKVIDTKHGEIGELKQVLDYPKQASFEIINKEDKEDKEILIPITTEIIVNVDRENQVIEVTTPEGLINLYLS